MDFVQTAPLRIGNYVSVETDSDLMLDGRGLPFIPGTSLAGIMRHMAVKLNKDNNIINHLFGIVDDQNNNTIIMPSAIIIGDAVLQRAVDKNKVYINRRDGVGLNEWGTVNGDSKYDFQIVETSESFSSIIEWEGTDEQYANEIIGIIDPIMKHFAADGFRAGARSSRGYGSFNVAVLKKEFEFPKELDAWIDYNAYDEHAFDNAEKLYGERDERDVRVEITFAMKGTFSVRVNTARTELAEDGSIPDSVPLENYKGNPIIPGTAWAGAFRHHMHDILRDIGLDKDDDRVKDLDSLFGMSHDNGGDSRSAITFSETEVTIRNKEKQRTTVMRTAIDRFTSSSANTALFTGMMYSGGEGKLNIIFNKGGVSEFYSRLLSACICDMHLGLMTVGGEASVGRGLMHITGIKVNDEDRLEQLIKCVSDGDTLDFLKEVTTNA